MRRSFFKIIQSSFSTRYHPKSKTFTKTLITKTDHIINPIIDKPFLSKTLDNEKCPELSPNKTINSDILSTILMDLQNEKRQKPNFKSNTVGFESITECFKYLAENRSSFNKHSNLYHERLFLTLFSSKNSEIMKILSIEENKIILNELSQEIEKKPPMTPFFPHVFSNEKKLKDLINIKDLAFCFIYSLQNYFKINGSNMELRKITDILKSWADLFEIYILDQKFKPNLQEILSYLFERVNNNIEKMSFRDKIKICLFMKKTNCIDSSFLDYMNIYFNLNLDNLELPDIFLVLILNNKFSRDIIPFELLYRLRETIMKKLKTLNSHDLLKVLEIYSRKKLFFFEKFMENIFLEIGSEENLSSFNEKDIVKLLYFYSNSRFRDNQFFEKLLKKIEMSIEKLDECLSLNLLIISLAHLNYTKQEFYIKLQKKFDFIEVIEKLLEKNGFIEKKDFLEMILKKGKEMDSNKYLEEPKPIVNA